MIDDFDDSIKIPSAFGKEKPKKTCNFTELPRVRALQKKYEQSSDEDILESFKQARITDSVLRFFLYLEAQKRGIENKLFREPHGKSIEFEENEIIIFRFVADYTRNSFMLITLLAIGTIFFSKDDICFNLIIFILFFLPVIILAWIAYNKAIMMVYLTNKKLVLCDDDYKQFIMIKDISLFSVKRCKFEIKNSFFGTLHRLEAIFYNEHVIMYNEIIRKKQLTNFVTEPKELFYNKNIYCYQEIFDYLLRCR